MLDVVGIVEFLEPNRPVSKRDGSGDVDARELVIFDDRFTYIPIFLYFVTYLVPFDLNSSAFIIVQC